MTGVRVAALSAVALMLVVGTTGVVRWMTLPPPPPRVLAPGVLGLAPGLDSLRADTALGDSSAALLAMDSVLPRTMQDSLAIDSLTGLLARLRSDSAAHALAASALTAAERPAGLPAFPVTRGDSSLLRLLGQSTPVAAADLLLTLDDSTATRVLMALPARHGAATLDAMPIDRRAAISRHLLALPARSSDLSGADGDPFPE